MTFKNRSRANRWNIVFVCMIVMGGQRVCMSQTTSNSAMDGKSIEKPELESEVFKDYDLYQAKEWIIKIKGLIIKTVKEWLKPEPGNYKLINDEIICYSVETGKQLIMDKGLEIEVVRSHPDKIIVRHDSDTYNLVGDNYIYFNWWFEKID